MKKHLTYPQVNGQLCDTFILNCWSLQLGAEDSDRSAHHCIDQVPYQTHLGPDAASESQKLAATSKPDIQDAAHVFAGLSHTCDTVCSQDKNTQCKNNLPLHRDVIMISVIIENWIGAPLSFFSVSLVGRCEWLLSSHLKLALFLLAPPACH